MKLLTKGLIILGSVMFLAACGDGNRATNPSNPPSANSTPTPSEAAAKPSPAASPKENHSQPAKGGQVVEAGKYHLEFVPEPEEGGTHLDLYLQTGDTHEAIPNAKVQARVQLPSGEQKTVDFSYDAEGKHYAVLLPETAAGDYKVVILTDVNGEKVNGRFNFKR